MMVLSKVFKLGKEKRRVFEKRRFFKKDLNLFTIKQMKEANKWGRKIIFSFS